MQYDLALFYIQQELNRFENNYILAKFNLPAIVTNFISKLFKTNPFIYKELNYNINKKDIESNWAKFNIKQ